MYGVSSQETRETCTAAAGTLLLEMGLLSRLTGDDRLVLALVAAVIVLLVAAVVVLYVRSNDCGRMSIH